MMSHVQIGLESFNITSSRHVTVANFERPVIDESYDAEYRPETPNDELCANLDALQERHRTPTVEYL
jgi:hypothetical protein